MSFLSEFTALLKAVEVFLAQPNNRYYFSLLVVIFIIWKYEFFINIWFRFKNRRLNEFNHYQSHYATSAEKKSCPTSQYLSFKIDELIQIRSTRIKNFKERCVFMYIASKPLEWDLGEIPLRRTIQHVGIGSTFFIDMKKYQTTKRKAITLAIIAFIIMGLSIAIGEHYNRADHELYASFFFIAPIAELYGLYQLDKVISKKALKKYHHALLKIDATHFAYQAN